eukprot:Opistho-2@17571
MNGLAVEPHPLFGGAMALSLPNSFVDVSAVREVPDNQEVLVHMETDQSVIVELVVFEEIADADAAGFHFDALAHDNEARQSVVHGVCQLAASDMPLISKFPGTVAFLLEGFQGIAKYNEAAVNTVRICMCVVRLPQFATDCLVTFNDPVAIDPHSSSKPGDVPAPTHMSPLLFKECLRTLDIRDTSLFGPTPESQ